jgi:hypothetical protein
MQVNAHVWRGFYDAAALDEDVGYNARAGTEILTHYLKDYALGLRLGTEDELARATYAMYHGGPRHALRVWRAETAESLRAIDESFYRKFLAVSTGDDLAVVACYPGG